MQNTQINCKSAGSNTVPISCTFCGSKNYADPFFQSPCFKAVYSSAPSNNRSPESKEGNCIFQQPLLSSPSFYNDLLPPNLFLASTFGTNSNYTSALDKKNNDIQKHASPPDEDSNFYQAYKSECHSNYLTSPTISNCISEPLESSQSQKPAENSQKSFIQRCACNNALPWICRPFLIPVVSYCVLWNSQTSNPNFSASNYFCTHQKSEVEKETEDTKAEASNLDIKTSEKKVFSNSNENEAQEKKKENQNEFWRGDKLKKNEWKITTHKDGSNSSFLSLNSINYTEEGGYYGVEKKIEIESLVENNFQESNLENIKTPSQEMISDVKHKEEKNTEDQKTSSEESDNEETLGLGQQILPDSDDLWFTDTSVKNTPTLIVEKLASLEPSPKVEVIKNYERLDESPINENLNQSTGENWTNEDRKKNLDIVEFSLPDRSSIKKSIKNFTMTEQVINTMNGEEAISMSVAAAGDLGRAQCAGYRVNLSFSKIDPQETQTEESSKLKGFSENSLVESHECDNNKDSKIQTSSNTNSSLKNFPKPKSGIAKLSGKVSTELSKNLRPDEKLQQKEILVTKKKRNCLLNENKAEISGNIVKPLKTKLSKFQEQAHETDKQFLKKNTNKNLTTKKEEKDKLTTVRLQNAPKIFKY